MELNGEPDTNPNSESPFTESDPASRRSFLGGMGLAGLGTMMCALAPASADAPTPASPNRLKLKSIGKIDVSREESFDVPGGKEYIVEYRVSDDSGVVSKFINHVSRVDSETSYTMTADVVIHSYAADADLNGEPQVRKEQHINIFAVKGETVGGFRHDHFTITTMHTDGSITRESVTVPVQLDVSEYAGKSARDLIASIGKKFIP